MSLIKYLTIDEAIFSKVQSKEITLNEAGVLALVRLRTSKGKPCTEHNKSMADNLGMGLATLRRCVDSLIEKGLLKKRVNMKKGNANRRELRIGGLLNMSRGCDQYEQTGCSNRAGGVINMSRPIERNIEKKNERKNERNPKFDFFSDLELKPKHEAMIRKIKKWEWEECLDDVKSLEDLEELFQNVKDFINEDSVSPPK